MDEQRVAQLAGKGTEIHGVARGNGTNHRGQEAQRLSLGEGAHSLVHQRTPIQHRCMRRRGRLPRQVGHDAIGPAVQDVTVVCR